MKNCKDYDLDVISIDDDNIISDNNAVPVELEGSPIELQIQPPGVLFAVNLGGPAYEATNKVVYADTQSLFEIHPERGKS